MLFRSNSVPIKLPLSFPKLSRAHLQPFSAYSHHNTNIHHLAYTFLLHKRPITDQPSYPPLRLWIRRPFLLVVQLSLSSPLIIFSLHSSNPRYSSHPSTQPQLKNVLQLDTNSPLLTKSFNLSINFIPLT